MKQKILFLLISCSFLSGVSASCGNEIIKFDFQGGENPVLIDTEKKIRNIESLKSHISSFAKKCGNFESKSVWSRNIEDHKKFIKETCDIEKEKFESEKHKDLVSLNPQKQDFNSKREILSKLIKKGNKKTIEEKKELITLSSNLKNQYKEIISTQESIESRTFVCKAQEDKTFTNGKLFIQYKIPDTAYNLIIKNWGKEKTKEAFEHLFIKKQKELPQFLSGNNQLEQKNFLENVCIKYYRQPSPISNKYLFIGFSEQEQEELLKCVLLNNKENLSIRGHISTVWGKERKTNIGIALESINGIWKQGETISLYEKTQSMKGYVDGLALFVDKEDKTKVISKPVYQGGICGVSTILYQTILGAYEDFEINERHPHLSFYKTYYNYDGIDASLYGENGHIYKDLKITNKSSGPLLVMSSNLENKHKNNFQYFTTIWSLYPFKKSSIQYGKKYNKGNHTCITNKILNNEKKELNKITSCYLGGMQ